MYILRVQLYFRCISVVLRVSELCRVIYVIDTGCQTDVRYFVTRDGNSYGSCRLVVPDMFYMFT